MNADEFVSTIQRCRPGERQAATHGLGAEDIAALQQRFTCPMRTPAREARADVLEDLLVRYDCRHLEIGRVRFVSAPRPHRAGTVVAFWEAEPLVVRPSGEVTVFEHEPFGEELMACARDGARLLDALARFLQMFFERGDWLGRTDLAAQLCAELAGGPPYVDFFVGLMGFFEYGATP